MSNKIRIGGLAAAGLLFFLSLGFETLPSSAVLLVTAIYCTITSQQPNAIAPQPA